MLTRDLGGKKHVPVSSGPQQKVRPCERLAVVRFCEVQGQDTPQHAVSADQLFSANASTLAFTRSPLWGKSVMKLLAQETRWV